VLFRISSYIVGFLFCAATATAQVGYTFTQLSTDDGLASNDVHALHQDEKGFIWIGSSNGLQRFDGTKFVNFFMPGKKDSDPLPISTLDYIVPGKNGTLWLYFPELREVGIFDPSKFIYRKVPIRPDKPIPPRINARLWKDRMGSIYLSIQPTGILKYDSAAGAFTSSAPFKVPENWSYGIRSAEDPRNGLLWLTFGDKGLAAYDYKTGETYTHLYNPKKIPLLNNWRVQESIANIFIDKSGRYWLYNWPVWGGGGEVIHCLDSTGTRYLKDTAGLVVYTGKYGEYRNMAELPKSGIWVFGLDKLFSFHKKTNKFVFYKSDPLRTFDIHYEVVHQVIEDREGGIWVATNEGLYFSSPGTDGNGVQNMMVMDKKGSHEFTDILELNNGDYWLTSWGMGVVTLDRSFKKKQYNIFKPRPASWPLATKLGVNLTWCMHQEKASGDVWIGSNGGILTRYNPVTDKTTYYNPPEFANVTVRYITEDKKGRLWFSTQRGRIIVYDNKTFRVVKDFGTAIIPKLMFDKDGWLWAAVQGTGIVAINSETGQILQQYTKGDNGLYASTGTDIDQLNDSTIAFGAGALNLINKQTKKVKVISYEQGLPSNSIQRLRIDRSGYLWINTNNGLCRYNPYNNNITTYSSRDGMVMSEKVKTADYLCSEGYVMFAGSNSLMFFQPEMFETNQQPPNVSITDFKLFNEYLPIDSLVAQNQVKLKYDQNSFSLYFSSLSYINRDKLIYYYKMDGIDENWQRADRQNLVNYSLLPPGKYVFNVYCENIDGVRSRDITTLIIHIKPPFWKTWWFLSLMGLAFFGLLYLMHRLRINRILAVENLRNRVARDLHDDMGSTLSTINILSTMAKSKLNTDNVRVSEYLGKISDNSQRMMEAMDDIVWSIKPMNDSMQKITARMREIATSVLEAKDIDLDFRTDPSIEEVKMDMEARRDFFLVFKEAINNIAKYSHANKAQVHLALHHQRLIMMVQDDGIGFDIDKADGNGLGNMYKRAASLKGRIQIQSKPGEGTQITLNIPVQ
jgi:ligand-binding sensor domain-containing protein/two-component sensor histidine kinase